MHKSWATFWMVVSIMASLVICKHTDLTAGTADEWMVSIDTGAFVYSTRQVMSHTVAFLRDPLGGPVKPSATQSSSAINSYLWDKAYYLDKQETMGATHSDQFYITGLISNDAKVIDLVYQRFAPGVERWVVANSGSAADAGDIFQEALIVIFRQAREKNLQLSCPFEAYLFLIVKRMWLNELKKRGRRGMTVDIQALPDIGVSQSRALEDAVDKEDRENQVMAFFDTLGERCKEILRLCLRKEQSYQHIASQLGVSYGYLRKKKSACLGSLVKKMEAANALNARR